MEIYHKRSVEGFFAINLDNIKKGIKDFIREMELDNVVGYTIKSEDNDGNNIYDFIYNRIKDWPIKSPNFDEFEKEFSLYLNKYLQDLFDEIQEEI